ncbi:hypothetical protein WJX75_008398 [Coccomyxa subellipsoidea]|uniref:CHRD domain-containing protein n=1 Tax=Coccomyxa subellipsoidea TaxID=248742 RepID=A0ABR2YK31_9CHLO
MTHRWGRSCVFLPFLLLLCGLRGQANARSDETGPVNNYTAILTGDKMVPPLNTSAHGEVDFSIHHHIHSKDDTAAYTITLFQVNHLIEVDLRQAHEGQPGDKIATLWRPSPNGLGQEVNGVLKHGTLTRKEMSKGPMSKGDMNELMKRADNGDIYVLVTTVEFPNGLLRGQMEPVDTG